MQLLNTQLGVASDRGSLRQLYLATEEQYLAAKKRVGGLNACRVFSVLVPTISPFMPLLFVCALGSVRGKSSRRTILTKREL